MSIATMTFNKEINVLGSLMVVVLCHGIDKENCCKDTNTISPLKGTLRHNY